MLKKTHDERDGAAKLVERAESLMEKLSAQVLHEKRIRLKPFVQ